MNHDPRIDLTAKGWQKTGALNINRGDKLQPFAEKAQREGREVQFFADSQNRSLWEVWMSPPSIENPS